LISQILFEIPAFYEMAVRSGSLIQIGGLLKDAASGKIVAHLQESGLAHSLIGTAMLGVTSPVSLGLSAVSQLANIGTGIYTAVQINQLKTMIEGLQSLQIATLGVSLLGVGVSVAGFLYMRRRFNAVDKRIDKLLDTVIHGFESQQKATLRSHLSQVEGIVQQASQACTLKNPKTEYSRIAERMAEEAAHFEGELEFVLKMNGKVNHELFWQLAQTLMACNSLRIDCRIRTNELRNALDVALGVGESYERLFGRLTPLSFDGEVTQMAKTITALKDITDVAATKPYLIDYLHSRRIDGSGYVDQLGQEKARPLLMLPVA